MSKSAEKAYLEANDIADALALAHLAQDQMINREQSLDMEPLEAMVNRHGLSGVLVMLAQIAPGKEG